MLSLSQAFCCHAWRDPSCAFVSCVALPIWGHLVHHIVSEKNVRKGLLVSDFIVNVMLACTITTSQVACSRAAWPGTWACHIQPLWPVLVYCPYLSEDKSCQCLAVCCVLNSPLCMYATKTVCQTSPDLAAAWQFDGRAMSIIISATDNVCVTVML